MRINDFFFGIAFLALGSGVVVEAREFPAVPGQLYGAAVFPTLVGAALVFFGLSLCVSGARDFRWSSTFLPPPWVKFPRQITAVLLTLGGLLFCALFAERLGFMACIFVLTFPLQLCLGARPAHALAVSAGTAAAIEAGFVWLLGAPLPRGLVESLFR